MKSRFWTLVISLAGGLAIAIAWPVLSEKARDIAGIAVAANPQASVDPHGHAHSETEEGHGEGKIAMTAEQVTAAGIDVAPVAAGVLISRVSVPGVLVASSDHLVRVTARVPGTIAEVKKRLGDMVAAGDVLAIIESREIADAKGEFLAASRAANLANVTLAREARLWKQRVTAEQDFLQARAAAEEATIRLDLARQRLSALGLAEHEIAALASQPVASLRRLELRTPIAGRVIARAAVQGAAVAADAELFSVADLTTLWVEMTIPPKDMPLAREGRRITIREGNARGAGRIVFLNPVLDPETRAARAVAEIDNAEGGWQPGGFVTAELVADEQQADLIIPRSAVQEFEGTTIVFLRTPEGFEKREIAIGREDATQAEVVFGLDAGNEIAVGNAFALRAELGKSEANHSH